MMKHKNSPNTMAIFCAIAPEYQIIDDEGWPEEFEEWQIAGANYAMCLPKKKLKSVNEYNSTKIIEYKQWTDEWYEPRK